ncbi:nuclear transport factor 2 family protein [Xanthomonas sp. AM6]|uniref:nuclear transport factor 2 family protein n=1 Tax=Xanthomonas sp. AM6 TaxID=2982531 RepID=UPI002955CFDD|nr:nuclear transport factor 2 family protein [Xanthomonas sp. AM6]
MACIGTKAATTILAALVLAASACGPARVNAAPAAVPAAAQTERNRQAVSAAFERWAEGSPGFFDELLARDVVWTIEGSGPSAGTYRGRDAFMAQAVRPFAIRLREPVRPVSRRIWADGDHVIVHWEGRAVARDGRPYRNRYAWIFRMADGKAVEAHAFLDLAAYDDVLRRIPARERAQ